MSLTFTFYLASHYIQLIQQYKCSLSCFAFSFLFRNNFKNNRRNRTNAQLILVGRLDLLVIFHTYFLF